MKRPRYKLSDLLKGMTKENRHPEIDFGPPVGREFGAKKEGEPRLPKTSQR